MQYYCYCLIIIPAVLIFKVDVVPVPVWIWMLFGLLCASGMNRHDRTGRLCNHDMLVQQYFIADDFSEPTWVLNSP